MGQTNFLLKKIFDMQWPSPGSKHILGYLIRFALESINSEIPQEQSTFDILRYYRNLWLILPVLRHIWGSTTRFETKLPFFLAVQSWPYHTFAV